MKSLADDLAELEGTIDDINKNVNKANDRIGSDSEYSESSNNSYMAWIRAYLGTTGTYSLSAGIRDILKKLIDDDTDLGNEMRNIYSRIN